MGLVSKGVKCNVSGCDEDSVRSLNTQKVEAAGLNVESMKSLLCKTFSLQRCKMANSDARPDTGGLSGATLQEAGARCRVRIRGWLLYMQMLPLLFQYLPCM